MDHRATKTSITGTAEKTPLTPPPPPPLPQVTAPPPSLPLSLPPSPNPIPFGARDRPVQRADARRPAGSSGQQRQRRRRRRHAHALGSSHVYAAVAAVARSFVCRQYGKKLESTSGSPSVTSKTSTNADVRQCCAISVNLTPATTLKKLQKRIDPTIC